MVNKNAWKRKQSNDLQITLTKYCHVFLVARCGGHCLCGLLAAVPHPSPNVLLCPRVDKVSPVLIHNTHNTKRVITDMTNKWSELRWIYQIRLINSPCFLSTVNYMTFTTIFTWLPMCSSMWVQPSTPSSITSSHPTTARSFCPHSATSAEPVQEREEHMRGDRGYSFFSKLQKRWSHHAQANTPYVLKMCWKLWTDCLKNLICCRCVICFFTNLWDRLHFVFKFNWNCRSEW